MVECRSENVLVGSSTDRVTSEGRKRMNSEQTQNPQIDDDRKAEDRNGGIDESDKVDRIRDILFGSQMRDYDGRFQRLEEHLIREVADVRADVQKRLEVLENFMKGEVESIRNRANAEQSERSGAIEKLGRDLMEAAKIWTRKLTTLLNTRVKRFAICGSSCSINPRR